MGVFCGEKRGKTSLRLQKKKGMKQRWTEMALVVQSALTSLNPVQTIESHFYDTLDAHPEHKIDNPEAWIHQLMGWMDLEVDVLGSTLTNFRVVCVNGLSLPWHCSLSLGFCSLMNQQRHWMFSLNKRFWSKSPNCSKNSAFQRSLLVTICLLFVNLWIA